MKAMRPPPHRLGTMPSQHVNHVTYFHIKLHTTQLEEAQVVTLIYLRARLEDFRVKKEEHSAQAARAGLRLKCLAGSFQLSSLG